jgi:hypothetical protein
MFIKIDIFLKKVKFNMMCSTSRKSTLLSDIFAYYLHSSYNVLKTAFLCDLYVPLKKLQIWIIYKPLTCRPCPALYSFLKELNWCPQRFKNIKFRILTQVNFSIHVIKRKICQWSKEIYSELSSNQISVWFYFKFGLKVFSIHISFLGHSAL